MKRSTAGRGAFALRVLWAVLMVAFGVLILTGQISWLATSLCGVTVLGVMFAEKALRRKGASPDRWPGPSHTDSTGRFPGLRSLRSPRPSPGPMPQAAVRGHPARRAGSRRLRSDDLDAVCARLR